jgi:flagellar biogenesis protein FliO
MNWSAARRHLLAAAVLLASAASVLAENPIPSPSHATGSSIALSLVRMIGALALVLAFFAGALWVVKNWQRFVVRNGGASRLNVLEVKSLGYRQALYVVGYEQQRLLLASSPAGVTMLAALPSVDETPAQANVVPPAKFTDIFLNALNRRS